MSDCADCAAESGVFLMSCIGCLKRLIMTEPKHKRRAVAHYALASASDRGGRGERIRRLLHPRRDLQVHPSTKSFSTMVALKPVASATARSSFRLIIVQQPFPVGRQSQLPALRHPRRREPWVECGEAKRHGTKASFRQNARPGGRFIQKPEPF
jgi:hypothetical protein